VNRAGRIAPVEAFGGCLDGVARPGMHTAVHIYRSEIRLDIDPRAVVGDGGGGRAGVEEEAR
jgi:hypothetical protein